MVQILEKRLEESLIAKKYVQLLEIAKETLVGDYKEQRVLAVFGIDMDLEKQGMMVMPLMNRVVVYDAAHFDAAYQLARTFEERMKEGFTVQKEYS